MHWGDADFGDTRAPDVHGLLDSDVAGRPDRLHPRDVLHVDPGLHQLRLIDQLEVVRAPRLVGLDVRLCEIRLHRLCAGK